MHRDNRERPGYWRGARGALFGAIRGRTKRLTFWEGDHDARSDELISESIAFLKRHIVWDALRSPASTKARRRCGERVRQ
jgi:hypothetical protein